MQKRMPLISSSVWEMCAGRFQHPQICSLFKIIFKLVCRMFPKCRACECFVTKRWLSGLYWLSNSCAAGFVSGLENTVQMASSHCHHQTYRCRFIARWSISLDHLRVNSLSSFVCECECHELRTWFVSQVIIYRHVFTLFTQLWWWICTSVQWGDNACGKVAAL